MKKIVLVAALLLGGCATSIMQGYIGRTVQDVALNYGPPYNVMDMPDGRRAFQWKISQTFVVPATSTTYGSANIYAPPGGSFGNISTQSTTVINPGGVSSMDCLYTMFGKWDGAMGAWVLTGYEKPRLICM